MVKTGHKIAAPRAYQKAVALKRAAAVEQLIFITDQARVPVPEDVCARLPEGSIVICRDYDHPDRRGLAKALRAVTGKFGLKLLVAGDAHLAHAVRADGVHLPEYQLMKTGARPAFDFVSTACHSRPALVRAARLGLDVALVSPVFPTASHPDAPALGVLRFAGLIARAGLPIAALGGITRTTAPQLKPFGLYAIAGISCFADL
ncbi:thiamine phosphate synthase [Kordiimonas marina]|uniref:thiamine phosphate synthase n=1 Tax=Kordiimonas marina TaxID=2872312 RepID=UPI001FF46D6C|nr:thiamine phosphate synthase [Kordiimonas marina]MCJ9429832.1 thiamine phosphate synthase [Kordiimonas marina]